MRARKKNEGLAVKKRERKPQGKIRWKAGSLGCRASERERRKMSTDDTASRQAKGTRKEVVKRKRGWRWCTSRTDVRAHCDGEGSAREGAAVRLCTRSCTGPCTSPDTAPRYNPPHCTLFHLLATPSLIFPLCLAPSPPPQTRMHTHTHTTREVNLSCLFIALSLPHRLLVL